MAPVLIHVTDPADPAAWGAEPALAGARAHFDLEEELVVAGTYREVADGAVVARAALDVQERSGMPVDVRRWLSDAPPRSSHPACLAVCAARVQGRERELTRALRLAFLAGPGPRPDTTDGLLAIAATVPGLDAARLRRALGSSGTLEDLGADLGRAAALGAAAGALPLLLLDGTPVTPDGLEGALRAAGVAEREPLVVRAALDAAPPGGLAAAEVAALCDLAPARAEGELWALALELRARPRRVGGGALWELAA